MRTLIILPTYNEIGNLRRTVYAIRSALPNVSILIVDDNSPDGTGYEADLLAGEAPLHIFTLHRIRDRGLGRSYLDGFRWALDRCRYDAIVTMDADGSHNPKYIQGMLSTLETKPYNIIQGSRWVPGAGVSGWAQSRQLISKAGSWYARQALGLKVKDITGGFRVYSTIALSYLNLNNFVSEGYSFQIETLYSLSSRGFEITEYPIIFNERVSGYSKMSWGIALESLRNVTLWGWQRFTGR